MSTTTWGHFRGREAESPGDIPKIGWKDILTRVKKGIKADRLSLISAAMAYYALFAFVPAISSVVLIYALVSNPSEISSQISSIAQFLPDEIESILRSLLQGLAEKAPSTLGVSAASALLVTLWSASKGSKAIITALNIIYGEEEKRGFIRRNALSLGLTFLASVLGVVAISTVIIVPALVGFFDFGPTTEIIGTLASWFILLTLFSFFLSFTYRYGPDRTNAKWRWVSWGAIIAALLWAMVSALFSIYAKEFGNFNKTYGSLGAVIVLMLWFYLSSFVVLLGAKINAEIEHQTTKDSTIQPDQPIGERGAFMADTVGKSREEINASGAKTSDAPDRHRSPLH